MSVIIRPSVDNDIAEAIPPTTLTGQWERCFEMERGVWHPPATHDRFWFLTQHHNLTFQLTCGTSVPKCCRYREAQAREAVIIGRESKGSGTLVHPCIPPKVLLLQSSPFQEGALPSTQLLKANITERWKNRDFFLPLKSPAPCIMHGTKYVFRNIWKNEWDNNPSRKPELAYPWDGQSPFVVVSWVPCWRTLCPFVYLSPWFHETFLKENLRAQIHLLMTACIEGSIREAVGGVRILASAQLLTRPKPGQGTI